MLTDLNMEQIQRISLTRVERVLASQVNHNHRGFPPVGVLTTKEIKYQIIYPEGIFVCLNIPERTVEFVAIVQAEDEILFITNEELFTGCPEAIRSSDVKEYREYKEPP